MTSGSTTIKGGRLFYGWIVVAACFFAAAITFGAVYSFGVFLTPFRETLGYSLAAISGTYSISLFLCNGFGIFAGWGVDKYGPKTTTIVGGLFLGLGLLLTSQVNTIWQLYVTYGLIGIGMSPVYAPLMTTVSRWFTQRRGLALGIFSTGIGAGPLIMAPLASYLVSTGGWRFAFLVIGATAGLVIASAFLMKKNPEQIAEVPNGKMYHAKNLQPNLEAGKTTLQSGGLSLKEAISTRAFWLLSSINLTIGAGLHMVLVHVVAYSQENGIPPLTAAAVLSTISGASIAGRIAMGTVSDRIGAKRTLAICLYAQGAMIFWLIAASNAWMLFLFGAIFGFFYGGYVPQLPVLTGEILGLVHMGAILGAASFFWGTGGALGPVLVGHIHDLTGSYASGFIIGAIAMFLAAVLTSLLKIPKVRREA